MEKKSINISLLIRAIGLLLALIFINICFTLYTANSNEQLLRNNKQLIESYANQKTTSINMVLEEGMEMTEGLASHYGVHLSIVGKYKYKLKRIMENSNFDNVRFIDRNGISYDMDGEIRDASRSDMYINGMQGNTGIKYEMRSDSMENRKISFYAPIYYIDRYNGVLVCSYSADKLTNLLNGDICGVPAGCLIINDDANVIAESANLPKDLLNIMEAYPNHSFDGLDKVDSVFIDMYDSPDPTETEKKLHQVRSFIYITRIDKMDWLLVQGFPAEAFQSLNMNVMETGLVFMMEIIICLIVYVLGLAFYHWINYRVTLKENTIKGYVVQGISRVFAKFVLLDFIEGTYEFLTDAPDDDTVESKGTFRGLIDYFARIIVEEDTKREFRDYFEPEVLRSRLERDNSVFNISFHLINSQETWDTLSVMAIERKGDRVTKALVINQHVTEMKKKEEERKKALKEALTTAEEANKAKSNFLSSMSHDIRTPMNAIMGFATLIKNEADNPVKVRDYIDKIQVSSEHLLGLINDILDMSKIESGKVVLSDEIFGIEELRNEIGGIIRPQMEKANKNYNVIETDFTYKYFRGDKLRIKQILLNLLSNAIKYTDEGGHITLEVSQQAITQNNKYINLKFKLSDDGIGMDEDFMEHIFEAFTRETNTLINKIQGTGLGMAITKSLVDMMNGTITVSSKKGEGSVFEVVIPLAIADEDAESVKEHEDVDESIFEGMKFLIAEDNEINYMVISSLLEMVGASTILAVNGREAVEIFKKSCKDDFDMIFMDLQMPEMDGLQAARAIRDIDSEWARTIPIIAMTANAYAEDVANTLNAGMNAHVAKPIDMKILTKTVKKLK